MSMYKKFYIKLMKPELEEAKKKKNNFWHVGWLSIKDVDMFVRVFLNFRVGLLSPELVAELF